MQAQCHSCDDGMEKSPTEPGPDPAARPGTVHDRGEPNRICDTRSTMIIMLQAGDGLKCCATTGLRPVRRWVAGEARQPFGIDNGHLPTPVRRLVSGRRGAG